MQDLTCKGYVWLCCAWVCFQRLIHACHILDSCTCSAAQPLFATPRRNAAATSSRPPRATTVGTGRCGPRREG
jgi:hypothetical protein